MIGNVELIEVVLGADPSQVLMGIECEMLYRKIHRLKKIDNMLFLLRVN